MGKGSILGIRRAPSTSLGISPAGSNARKTAQLRRALVPQAGLTLAQENKRRDCRYPLTETLPRMRERRRSTHVFFHAGRIRGRSAPIKFAGNLAQPVQLRAKLLDDEFDHPDSFMKTMAHFRFNRAQRRFFSGEFALEKFLPPLELFADDARRCLPGKRYPGEERRTV